MLRATDHRRQWLVHLRGHQEHLGAANTTHTNTVTAIAVDNEANSDSASDSEVVSFSWRGRTPGYWKNHPKAWPTAYPTTKKVQDVFSIPYLHKDELQPGPGQAQRC